MKIFAKAWIAALCVMSSLIGYAQNPLWQGKGRIAISSDGNEHDDDDWAATALSLAMLNAGGLQNHVTLYTYSDHIWGSNQCYPLKSGMCAYDQMKESALGAQMMFNFKNTRFLCAVDNAEVAYTAMCKEINLSTETNPLLIVAAGPMQVVGEALNRSNINARKYVTILSHSAWNDHHAEMCHSKRTNMKVPQPWDVHDGWTWAKMKKAFEAPENGGVRFVHIKDQNGDTDDDGLKCKRTYYDWMKTSPARKSSYYKAGSWDWLYSRMESCLKGPNQELFDTSDAGMIIYLLTGKESGTADDVRKIMENPCKASAWK